MIKILGIESSCDETSAAVVTDDTDVSQRVLSNVVRSQTEVHAPFGGVVPELSSRAHIDVIDQIITQALKQADTSLDQLDAIAVTSGPGLIGGVIVGVMAAKGLALASNKPLIGVNHLEGHALTVRMTDDVTFPYLLLLVSGGHCQILSVNGVGDYTLLGKTLDDALGEAFDKTAKMLGLGYPGGPKVEQLAKTGDEKAFKFPKPLCKEDHANFSFSGLKTAVFREIDRFKHTDYSDDEKATFTANICSSFQDTVGDVLENRLERAIASFKELHPSLSGTTPLVIGGGVAANQYIKHRLRDLAARHHMEVISPPISLCTDNGAMIAWAGLEQFRLGNVDDLSITPRARWPLAV